YGCSLERRTGQRSHEECPYVANRPRKPDMRRLPRCAQFIDIALHSITSSASTSRLCTMVRSSTLAVLRLMTRSNLVGCSTGKHVGNAQTQGFKGRMSQPGHVWTTPAGHVWTTPAGQGILAFSLRSGCKSCVDDARGSRDFGFQLAVRVQVMCPACLRGAH